MRTTAGANLYATEYSGQKDAKGEKYVNGNAQARVQDVRKCGK